MTGRLNEVDACVDTVIHHLVTVNAVLLLEIGIETGLNVVEDGPPAE